MKIARQELPGNVDKDGKSRSGLLKSSHPQSCCSGEQFHSRAKLLGVGRRNSVVPARDSTGCGPFTRQFLPGYSHAPLAGLNHLTIQSPPSLVPDGSLLTTDC